MKLRILLFILVPVLLLFLCALVIMWVPLPHPVPPPLSGGRNQMAAIVTGLLGVGYLIGLVVYLVSSFQQAGRVLEPVLASAGLASKSYLLFGRQYQGLIQGRQVAVTFVPPQGVSHAQLNVYVRANLGTRVAIGPGKPLLDCSNCPRVEVSQWDLGSFEVYAQDQEGAHRLLADPESRETVKRLLSEGDLVGHKEVYLQPERVWLRVRPERVIEEEQFERWFEQVLALAEAGEKAFESSE